MFYPAPARVCSACSLSLHVFLHLRPNFLSLSCPFFGEAFPHYFHHRGWSQVVEAATSWALSTLRGGEEPQDSCWAASRVNPNSPLFLARLRFKKKINKSGTKLDFFHTPSTSIPSRGHKSTTDESGGKRVKHGGPP